MLRTHFTIEPGHNTEVCCRETNRITFLAVTSIIFLLPIFFFNSCTGCQMRGMLHLLVIRPSKSNNLNLAKNSYPKMD